MPALVALIAGCTERPAPILEVTGVEYAFMAPDSVAAGPTELRFTNQGKRLHEMVLVQLRDDVPTQQVIDSLSRGARMRGLRAAGSGVLFAKPGERNDGVRLRMTFERGHRYVLLCQFRDTATAPKHVALGMFKILGVR